MHNMRSYAMRGAVPVLFAAHLLILAVTRQVSALNPALRIPPNVRGKANSSRKLNADSSIKGLKKIRLAINNSCLTKKF